MPSLASFISQFTLSPMKSTFLRNCHSESNTFAKFKIELKLIELNTIYCANRKQYYQYIDFSLSQNKIGEGVMKV